MQESNHSLRGVSKAMQKYARCSCWREWPDNRKSIFWFGSFGKFILPPFLCKSWSDKNHFRIARVQHSGLILKDLNMTARSSTTEMRWSSSVWWFHQHDVNLGGLRGCGQFCVSNAVMIFVNQRKQPVIKKNAIYVYLRGALTRNLPMLTSRARSLRDVAMRERRKKSIHQNWLYNNTL